MGSKASKPAQTLKRKFPARAPGTTPTFPQQRTSDPKQTPSPKASFAKDEAILADSIDPDFTYSSPAFGKRLQQMGIASPSPTLSNSSIAMPRRHGSSTMSALEARQRLQQQAESEFENMADGRELVDVGTLRQALVLRERGTTVPEIERRLRLKSGVVAKLGAPDVISPLV